MGGLAKNRHIIGAARDQQQRASEQILSENISAERPVPGREIAGLRGKADIAAIGRDIGIEAGGIALIARAIGRDPQYRPAQQVLAVDIGHAIAVARHHGRAGGKHHIAPIGRDGRLENTLQPAGQALAIRPLRGAGDRPAQHILDEDIIAVVAVRTGEVGRGAVKGDITAIGGKCGRVHRTETGLRSIGGEVHPQRLRCDHILAEDIDRVIGIVRHDIAGGAEEDNIAAISRDRRPEGDRIGR